MINIARNMAIDCTRSKHEKNKSKIQDSIDDVYVINNKLLGEQKALEEKSGDVKTK